MKALILVDIQNDFLRGGALPVPQGSSVVPVANRVSALDQFALVLATQDWHPRAHVSFAANHPNKKPGDMIDLDGLEQTLWPVHCVQDTHGAELVAGLRRDRIEHIFQKGTDPRIDSYSGFFDNGHRKSTGLGEFLRERGVKDVVVLGLATDYCVKFTALDARNLGFGVVVLTDGCRAGNVRPGDGERAIAEMKAAGIVMSTAVDFLQKKQRF